METPAETSAKTKPIPTRFTRDEDAFLHTAARETGLPVSELVRRSVRLMRRQKEVLRSNSFIIELA